MSQTDMSKIILILASVLFALVGGFYWLNSYIYEEKQATATADYKDAEYVFSGEPVKLEDGVGETSNLMGSASKTTVRYFGNEVRTDLNGDGREDVVFLVTQDGGGSGTFFYAVAALNTERGYVGSEAVLIGDRIAPQTTNIDERGFVVVNYADRAPNEPMTARPSIGKSLYLKFNAASMQFGEVVPDFEGESSVGVTLDLSGQGLTKVPAYVFERKDVETLNLSNNRLEGALQAEVRHLQNLRVLDLSDNRFTGVPAEVGQLAKLEILDLSNNQLTGLPYELGNLQNLKTLDISGNSYAEQDLSIIRGKLPSSTVIKTK